MTVARDPAVEHPLVAADHLRLLLRRQAASVAVITTEGEHGPVGLTATSFTSVSLHPPLVSVCLNRGASSWPAMQAARYVAVHLLRATQAEVARTFATSGIDRFAAVPWQPGPYGMPWLDDVLARLICRVGGRIVAGDHAIVLGEPVLAEYADGAPLLYHDGNYAELL
jgi:flavin reductase (DIM6/NTAB) family NADH-FMN oxidoreductase RutF